MFLRDFAPLIHQQLHDTHEQIVEEAVKKAFHAWHAHDVEEICPECDPEGMELRRLRREERRRKQAEQKNAQANGAA